MLSPVMLMISFSNLKTGSIKYLTMDGTEVDEETKTGMRVITLNEHVLPFNNMNRTNTLYVRYFYEDLFDCIRQSKYVILLGDAGTATSMYQMYAAFLFLSFVVTLVLFYCFSFVCFGFFLDFCFKCIHLKRRL